MARVFLFYVLFCWLFLSLGLTLREARENGLGLTAPPWSLFWPGSEGLASAKPAKPVDAALGLPFVGVTVDLEHLSPSQRAIALERLSDHGVGWARQRFDWNVLEPMPGAFDRQQSDAIVAAIIDSGLTPIAVLDGSPAWARRPQDRPPTDNPLAPPGDPAAYADFAAAFAERYGEHVRFYQIWDEPNIAPHWGNQHIEPTAYAHLLIQAAQTIRAGDDDAVIIAGALAPTADRGHTAVDEVYFLQRMYATGVQPHVDMMAIEPFGFGHSAQDPTQQPARLNFQRAALVRRAMVAAGDGSTPLLAARFGWNRRPASPWATVDPGVQHAYLNDALTVGWRRWPWLAGMGWVIDQPNAPVTDPLWGFALDDGLIETVDGWIAATRMPRSGYPWWMPWEALLASMGLAIVFWRGGVAVRLLPWMEWKSAYRSFRPPAKILLWLFLLALYHFAVAWPLLLLLLIMASILIAMAPRTGLWLAAALLPLHFQHKELNLVNASLMLPPAQALALASLPAIALRVRKNGTEHRLIDLPQILQPLDWFGIGWLGIGLLAMVNVWYRPAYWTGVMDLMIVPLLLYSDGAAICHGSAISDNHGGGAVRRRRPDCEPGADGLVGGRRHRSRCAAPVDRPLFFTQPHSTLSRTLALLRVGHLALLENRAIGTRRIAVQNDNRHAPGRNRRNRRRAAADSQPGRAPAGFSGRPGALHLAGASASSGVITSGAPFDYTQKQKGSDRCSCGDFALLRTGWVSRSATAKQYNDPGRTCWGMAGILGVVEIDAPARHGSRRVFLAIPGLHPARQRA